MKKHLLLMTACCLIITSCSLPKRSALSDTEINDPHLIKPEITLKRSKLISGGVTQSITASLRDSNNDFIEIKEGGVSCGIHDLTVVNSYIGNIPRYKITDNRMTLNFDTRYIFKISLSKEKAYNAEIKTPGADFLNFEVPKVAIRGEAVTLKWDGLDKESHLEIAFTKEYKKGEQPVKKTGTIRIGDPHKDKYSLQPDFFVLTDHVLQKASFTLRATDYGKVDPMFRGGGFIKMTTEIEKEILFRDN